MLVCPICNRNDAVENVGGLVERSKNWYGFSTTSLGLLMEHPDKPGKIGCGALLAAVMVVAIVFTPIFFIGWLRPLDQNILFRYFVFGLVGVAAGVVAAVLFILALRTIRNSGYKRELVNWEAKMDRWNRLYYCNRDHVVFDTETGHTAAPEEIENFLADATKRPEGATEQDVTMARTKSYSKPAIVALVLELLPFLYPAGLAVNLIYMVKGSRMQKIAGRKLPGVTFLKVLFWFNVIGWAAWFSLALSGVVVFGLPALR